MNKSQNLLSSLNQPDMENTIEMEAPVFQINTGKHKNNIEIKGVNVSFKTPHGAYTAVKDISLTVQKGEIVSLIGHSGCGKSTLMGTISGMVKPTTGEVFANGKKVTSPGPDRGLVFQNYSLLPWLTVYQNIYEAVDSSLKDRSTAEKKDVVEKNLKM